MWESPWSTLCILYSAASEGLKGKPITGPKLKKPPPSSSTLTHITQKTQDILHGVIEES